MFPRMHVSIYVKNLNESVDFYRRWWNEEPEKVRPGYAKFHLNSPGLVFSMVENAERAAGNFGHLGIQVESEAILNEWKSGAESAGFAMREEIGVNCCYAVQDKFWLTDPDGVQWEVYYFHEDAEFNDPKYDGADTGSADACCGTSFSIENLRETKVKLEAAPLPSTGKVASAGPVCEPGSGCC